MSRSVLAVMSALCLGACGDLLSTRPDAGVVRVKGRAVRAAGGVLTHQGLIRRDQRVTYTQALEAGTVEACVSGRKSRGAPFRGHLEVMRQVPTNREGYLEGLRAEVLRRFDSQLVDSRIYEWQGWCEYIGYLAAGDSVRLVSDLDAEGNFTFEVTLRVP